MSEDRNGTCGARLRYVGIGDKASHQKRPLRFANESARWRAIVENLAACVACCPEYQKGLFVSLQELQTFAERALRRSQDAEGMGRCEQRSLFS